MSDPIPNCTPAVNLITTLTFLEPSMSPISITFTSFLSDKRPVPKNKLDFSAAIALLAARPLATNIFTPSKERAPLAHHCVPCAFVPEPPTPAAAKPPKALT